MAGEGTVLETTAGVLSSNVASTSPVGGFVDFVVMPQASNEHSPLQSVVWLVAIDAGSAVAREPLAVLVAPVMSRFFGASGLPSSA